MEWNLGKVGMLPGSVWGVRTAQREDLWVRWQHWTLAPWSSSQGKVQGWRSRKRNSLLPDTLYAPRAWLTFNYRPYLVRLSDSSKFGGYCFWVQKCGENLIFLEGQYKFPLSTTDLLFRCVKNLKRERSLSTTPPCKNNSKVQVISKGRSPKLQGCFSPPEPGSEAQTKIVDFVSGNCKGEWVERWPGKTWRGYFWEEAGKCLIKNFITHFVLKFSPRLCENFSKI